MTKLLLMSLAIAVSGCATSTGVMPMGDDTYMVSKQSANAFKDPALLKAEAYQEANNYCGKQNKKAQVVSSNIVPGGFGHRPSAEIDFNCVSSDTPRTPSSN